MKIILLENVANLGEIGSVVVVNDGFARNFLIPSGKAKLATKENIADFEKRGEEYKAKQDKKVAIAQSKFDQINEKLFTVLAKAGVDGKLFGSVTAFDIAGALKASGVEIKKSEVALPNGPLKTVGEFDVTVILHHGINAVVKVNVAAEA